MILDVSNPLAGGYLDRSAPWTTYSAILHITNDGTDVLGDQVVSILVDDLISSEEAQDVVGIYMILDVSNPLAGGYLDRSAPWTTYSAIYYKQPSSEHPR
jgi:hypothetical protein